MMRARARTRTWLVAALALVASSRALAGCTKQPTYVADTTSSSSTSGSGACARAGDCPGTDGECSYRTCIAGACGRFEPPKGFAVHAQVAGDCKRAQCDGKGNVEAAEDDTDVPDDRDPCTHDACSGGKPTHTPEPAGAPCGKALTCDGSGVCKGCMQSSDCGPDEPCVTRHCMAGACALAYVPSGQGQPGAQLGGDCHKLVCNGTGGVATVVDDTDPPDDGNPCTKDDCAGGVAVHASVAKGAPCGGGNVCDAGGICATCANDADCGISGACARFTCTSGHCEVASTPLGAGKPPGNRPGDCLKPVCDGNGGAVDAADDGDVPADANPCFTFTCKDGALLTGFAATGKSCGTLQCDSKGVCGGCQTDMQCPASDACSSFGCVAGSCEQRFKAYGTGAPPGDVQGDCLARICDGEGHAASTPDANDAPVAPSACIQTSCTAGTPTLTPTSPGTPCSDGGTKCDGGGRCVK